MNLIEVIDPFVMQLFIVPLVVIGLGVLVSYITKKIFIAPIVTLLLNLLYEFWYMKYFYLETEVTFTSWNIYFPIFSLVFALAVVLSQKYKNK